MPSGGGALGQFLSASLPDDAADGPMAGSVGPTLEAAWGKYLAPASSGGLRVPRLHQTSMLSRSGSGGGGGLWQPVQQEVISSRVARLRAAATDFQDTELWWQTRRLLRRHMWAEAFGVGVIAGGVALAATPAPASDEGKAAAGVSAPSAPKGRRGRPLVAAGFAGGAAAAVVEEVNAQDAKGCGLGGRRGIAAAATAAHVAGSSDGRPRSSEEQRAACPLSSMSHRRRGRRRRGVQPGVCWIGGGCLRGVHEPRPGKRGALIWSRARSPLDHGRMSNHPS